MKDRFVTLIGALTALFIAASLFLSRGAGRIEPPSRPTSRDTGDYGMAAAARWLRQSGIPVLALRRRYSELPELGSARSGNLLIASEPMRYPARRGELQTLKGWVQRGNDLLLLEASAEQPVWAQADGFVPPNGTLYEALDLERHELPKHADTVCGGKDLPEPDGGSTAALLRPHPDDLGAALLAGVRELRVKPDPATWRLPQTSGIGYRPQGRASFSWLCDTARGRSALWQFRLGRGRIWIATYPQLFANADIDTPGNARLLANLVGISATGDGSAAGAVIFDDMHQGDSELYDPAAFFGDPRFHASLWLLLALWLLYLLGYSNRFAPPAAPPTGVTPARFVESLGGFFARHLAAAEGGEALLRGLHVDLARRQGRAVSSATLWDCLADLPGLDPQLSSRLRDAAAQLRTRRSRDLRPLAGLIHQIRKQLS